MNGSERSRPTATLDDAIADYLTRQDRGEAIDQEAWLREHAPWAAELREFLETHRRMRNFSGLADGSADDAVAARDSSWPTGQLARPSDQANDAAELSLGDEGQRHARRPDADPDDSGRDASDSTIARTGQRFGDYELLSEIAAGGMGVVYKARQVKLDRVVAIKMIKFAGSASVEDVRRFISEAEAAAKLDHAGIIPIYEVKQVAGRHYYSMAYVDGEDLGSRLARGPLPPREAARIVMQVAAAMAYAHGRGVIHRDLKPSNIMLGSDGHPRITDFGLAKRLETDARLTTTGQILGTPSYMPPEQAAGRLDLVGPRSDVYSIGAILYALLTGRPPFQAETSLEIMLQVLENEPPPPSSLQRDLPRDLQTICLKCLSKDPDLRYASADQLRDDLRRFLDGETIVASNVNMLDRMSRALMHTRHEEQLRSWSRGLFWMACTILLAHVAVFGLTTRGAGVFWALGVPRATMFAALAGLLVYYRRQALLPTNPVERLVWVLGIGYILSTIATNLLVYLGDLEPLAAYAIYGVLSGLMFFSLGAHLWGGCYVIGLAFLLGSPALIRGAALAPLGFGLLWTVALFLIGYHYRQKERTTTAG